MTTGTLTLVAVVAIIGVLAAWIRAAEAEAHQ